MPHAKRHGQTSSECLFILITFMGGIAVAWYAAATLNRFGLLFGWLGMLVGFIVGAAATFGLLYGVVLVLVISEASIWGGIPYLPTCGSGRCSRVC